MNNFKISFLNHQNKNKSYLKYITFISENGDCYRLYPDNIISANFNGKNIEDFIYSQKNLINYEIKMKQIWKYNQYKFYNKRYSKPYSYCDFCGVEFTFNDMIAYYDLIWCNNLDYKDYSQTVKKIRNGYKITYDINRKKDIFKSYYFEQLVKDMLFMPYDKPLKGEDILNINKLEIDRLVHIEIEENLEDFAKFTNLKQLRIEDFSYIYDPLKTLLEILDYLPNLNKLIIDHPFSKEELKHLCKYKNIKSLVISDCYYTEDDKPDIDVISDIKTLPLPFDEPETYHEETKIEELNYLLKYVEYIKDELSKRKYKRLKKYISKQINRLTNGDDC